GRIVDIVERRQNNFIGTLAHDEEGYCVELGSPNNHQPITVTEENVQALNAKQGAPVKVDIIDWPNQHEFATGKMTEVLSDDNDRELIIETTLLNYDIPSDFSEAALQQANSYQEPTEKDLKGRTDLRDLPLITIDGEDARDFDDAVFAEKRDRKSTRLNSSHVSIAYAVFCLKKKRY